MDVINNNPQEIWRPIPRWEGIYEVSNIGRIRRRHKATRKWRIVKLTNYGGYETVYLAEMMGVHSLVARVFVGPKPPGHWCNHKDSNRSNNVPENLEWVTPRENVMHAIKVGFFPKGKSHWSQTHPEKWSKKPFVHILRDEQVQDIKQRIALGESNTDIAKDFPVDRHTISDIRVGKTWRHIRA